MDEFGDIDAKDLESLKRQIQAELERLSSVIEDLGYAQKGNAIYDAYVVSYVDKDSDDEKTYGYGSLYVAIPALYITKDAPVVAKPIRVLQGRFEIPPKESWVKLVSGGYGTSFDFYYYGAHFLSVKDMYPDFTSKEEIGFQPQIPQVS